jgi:hypothetical protein
VGKSEGEHFYTNIIKNHVDGKIKCKSLRYYLSDQNFVANLRQHYNKQISPKKAKKYSFYLPENDATRMQNC